MKLSDPRLHSLSPKARDLLERILETFPHDDLFGCGVPAAPAQLRLTLYHSDDSRLDPDIGRQLKEFELLSIGILRRVSRKTRLLKLTLDFSGAPEGPLYTSLVNAESRNVCVALGDRALPSSQVPRVIHNPAGLSPPLELKNIAAAAADPLDFCTRVRELGLFPGIDLVREWNDYVERCPKRATLPIFAEKVLPRAQRRFGKISQNSKQKRSVGAAAAVANVEIAGAPTCEDQLNLFEPNVARSTLREVVERQLRLRKAI